MAGWDDPAHRLDASCLKDLFREVDWQVGLLVPPESEIINLIVCGGAAMCYLDPERGTGDVDLIHPPIPPAVREAAKTVGRRRGLGPGWINDAPTSFADYSAVIAPNVLYEGSSIRVSAPDNRYLLGMKLHAARDDDLGDLLLLSQMLGVSRKQAIHEAAEMVSRSIGRQWEPTGHQKRVAARIARSSRAEMRRERRQKRQV